jgi:hypothetical protein
VPSQGIQGVSKAGRLGVLGVVDDDQARERDPGDLLLAVPQSGNPAQRQEPFAQFNEVFSASMSRAFAT